MAQTSYTQSPAIGQEGVISSSQPTTTISKVAEGAVSYGLAVVSGTGDNQCAAPTAVAADDDALVLTSAALGTAGGTSYSGVGLDGAIGTGRMNPARNVTLTLGNDVNWDATTATITGLDEDGTEVVEELAIPNGGNATVSGKTLFTQITSISIPVQSGDAPGSIGIGTRLGQLRALGVALLDPTRDSASLDFADGDAVPILRKGRMFVITEDACADGDPVYVRLVAGVGEELGALRDTPDGTVGAPDCAILRGARFVTTASAGQLAEIELDMVGR